MPTQLEALGNKEDMEQECEVMDPFQEVFDDDDLEEGHYPQPQCKQPTPQVGHPPKPPLDPGGRKATPVLLNLKVSRWQSLQVHERIIKHTLEATTQYAGYPQSEYLRKVVRSPFPTFNIPRQSESTATDTVYSGIPMIGSGETIARLFVGWNTMDSNVCGMKNEKQLCNMLQDVIQGWGAMDKLLSDWTQVKILEGVKEILCTMFISDRQLEPLHEHQNFVEQCYQTMKAATN